MTLRRSRGKASAEIFLALLLIAVCAVVLWESRKIPPGTFEPLGSAPVPQATAGLIILLCLLVIVRAWRRTTDNDHALGDDAEPLEPRTLDAALFVALTLVYVLLLQLRLAGVGFAPLTTLYLVLTIGLLTRFRWRRLPLTLLVAAAMGYGCQYLFTQVFVVDLPGVF